MTNKQNRIPPAIRTRARELRQPQTPAERVLWGRLRNRELGGYKFRRQHPIGRFIVDFYCAECCLAIEIDGDTHLDQVEYDAERIAWLEAQGHRVVRFTNQDVHHRTVPVLETILKMCQERSSRDES